MKPRSASCASGTFHAFCAWHAEDVQAAKALYLPFFRLYLSLASSLRAEYGDSSSRAQCGFFSKTFLKNPNEWVMVKIGMPELTGWCYADDFAYRSI